jgi:hypothetical protein
MYFIAFCNHFYLRCEEHCCISVINLAVIIIFFLNNLLQRSFLFLVQYIQGIHIDSIIELLIIINNKISEGI